MNKLDNNFFTPRTKPLLSKEEIKARFFLKVEDISFASDEDCWNWIGKPNACGYGLMKINWVEFLAHRISFHLYKGHLCPGVLYKPNYQVLHTCDNRMCINPNHLFLGDNTINVNDRNKKGRQARGVTHSRAILTEEQVKRIRILYKEKKGNRRQLSERFGVTLPTISSIVDGYTWRHI